MWTEVEVTGLTTGLPGALGGPGGREEGEGGGGGGEGERLREGVREEVRLREIVKRSLFYAASWWLFLYHSVTPTHILSNRHAI